MFNFSSCTDNKHTVRVSTQCDGPQHRDPSASSPCIRSAEASRQPGHGSYASQPTTQCCNDAAPCQHGGICPFSWDSHRALWQRQNRATFLHCFILHAHLASRTTLEVIQHTRQQPRHHSSASVMLTNELHTRNCSHVLSSDSISPPHPCSD